MRTEADARSTALAADVMTDENQAINHQHQQGSRAEHLWRKVLARTDELYTVVEQLKPLLEEVRVRIRVRVRVRIRVRIRVRPSPPARPAARRRNVQVGSSRL